MANLFDKMIEDLKKANGGEEDEIISALRAKREELGDDASEKDIAEAIQSCLMEQLSGALSGNDDDEPVVLSEENKDYMEKLLPQSKSSSMKTTGITALEKFEATLSFMSLVSECITSISGLEFMLKQILMFAVLMRFFPSRQMLLMSIPSAKC